jgi:hypothetical protein
MMVENRMLDAPPLCSHCFANIGLQREAEQVSQLRTKAPCKRCSKVGGAVLDSDAARQLMSNFFVFASTPPDVGGPAYVYQFNEYHYPGVVEFGTEIDADVQLLSNYLGVGLFQYGPPLWRLGYTEHYQTLREGDSATRDLVWDDILGRCAETVLGQDVVLYRVRKGEDLIAPLASEFDSPPASVRIASSFGRYDSEALPILYVSENTETCLHECRVTLSDYINVAALRPSRDLRLLNLTEVDDTTMRTEFDSVARLLTKFAFCGKRDYDLCKELAHKVKAKGYDGFVYLSYFRQAHEVNLTNIAVFGYPLRDGLLSLASVNRVKLTRVSYGYSFGPPQDVHALPDADEITKLANETRRAEGSAETLKTFARRLEDILARRRR